MKNILTNTTLIVTTIILIFVSAIIQPVIILGINELVNLIGGHHFIYLNFNFKSIMTMFLVCLITGILFNIISKIIGLILLPFIDCNNSIIEIISQLIAIIVLPVTNFFILKYSLSLFNVEYNGFWSLFTIFIIVILTTSRNSNDD